MCICIMHIYIYIYMCTRLCNVFTQAQTQVDAHTRARRMWELRLTDDIEAAPVHRDAL